MVSNAVSHVLESDQIYSPCANLTSVEEYPLYSVPELNTSCEDLIINIAVTITFTTGLVMVSLSVIVVVQLPCCGFGRDAEREREGGRRGEM